MRHRVSKKYFNRDTKARRALLLGVAVAVLEHGEIVTTKAKAKEAARLIDSAISKAKKGDLAAKRQLHRIFGRRDVVNNLCERVAPVFANRQSGFTRLTKMGNRRGDNTTLYRLSLVEVLPESKKAEDKKQTTAKKAVKQEQHAHDEQARDAVKAEQDKTLKAGSKLKNMIRGNKTAGRTSVTGGGRGK
ncbi:50S ribosomal protein L17 [bacterium]|nr:50S ribosomal protein L17 [bacterium]MBQ6436256.1 50S ribosomal protein L17 [bacterium]